MHKNCLFSQFLLKMDDSEHTFEINGYIFTKLIGSGLSSVVYEVYSKHYNQKFCAKVISLEDCFFDEEGNLFEPEIEALINLDHPNIIRIYSFFVHQQNLFLILELCKKCLIDEITKHGAFEQSKLKKLTTDICKAIEYCHRSRIAHRDIKPANIFLDQYDRPKVADFGLCALLRPKEKLNTACGSYNYVAPEVLSNKDFDPFKADVYSLGVTLYQMAMGKLPYDKEHRFLGFKDNIDPDFKDFVTKMLSSDPDCRPTMKQILDNNYFQTNEIKFKSSNIIIAKNNFK